jgi:hypothetical protein
MSHITRTLLLIAGTAVALSACDSFKSKDDAPPPRGNLTRNLTLIGADGKNYGTVELDPVNGGRLYDVDGRLIGTVITPAPGTAQPY